MSRETAEGTGRRWHGTWTRMPCTEESAFRFFTRSSSSSWKQVLSGAQGRHKGSNLLDFSAHGVLHALDADVLARLQETELCERPASKHSDPLGA